MAALFLSRRPQGSTAECPPPWYLSSYTNDCVSGALREQACHNESDSRGLSMLETTVSWTKDWKRLIMNCAVLPLPERCFAHRHRTMIMAGAPGRCTTTCFTVHVTSGCIVHPPAWKCVMASTIVIHRRTIVVWIVKASFLVGCSVFS